MFRQRIENAALKKHANHKQTPKELEMPFKTSVDKIGQMELTRTITNNHKRLYQVNQSSSTHQLDIDQITEKCSNVDNLDQNNLE